MGGCVAKEQLDFEGPIDFRHFEILRAIGKGAFGKVCIVKKKDNKEMYAMKYMNKVQIIDKRAVDNVFREIHILKALDHPFIVNLWFAFQDEEDIFLVLDLMLGGDLSYHLEKEGRFSVPRVQLYMAEICLALDYLAEQNIVHRDLKPANMLLDSKGHIHLTDFNVASIQRPGKVMCSMTGTKPYMAPEVIRPPRTGYTTAVDWWSLGVSAYEMLRGERPYTIHHSTSTDEMYRIFTKVRPPASARWTESTCNVLKMLLHPEPTKRLASLEKAKLHPFFEDINWERVYKLESKPEYVPSQNRIHCDPTHELEEMIVEPNPLHKKKSRLSKRRNNEVGGARGDLDGINDRFKLYNRFTDSVLRVASNEDDTALMETSIPAGTCTSTMDTNNIDTIRDTALSLRRDSNENHTHNVPVTINEVSAQDITPTTSPIQVIVQDYEIEHAKESANEQDSATDPSPDDGSSPKTTESSPIDIAVESHNETENTKVQPDEQHSVTTSTTEQDIISEAALSSGTPVYNPKDSDSMVPMHLLGGSYSESMEGEFVVMDVVVPPTTNEVDDETDKDGDDKADASLDGVVLSTSVEIHDQNHSKEDASKTNSTEDSDTQVLV